VSERQRATEFWDLSLARWTSGDADLSPELTRWQQSYSGRGPGAVDLSVFPEPYVGPLAGQGTPALVMLGLNPGPPAPEFQAMHGIFTEQIAATTYGEWAASAPYTSSTWEQIKGRNKYHRDRLAFARRLHEDSSIEAADLLYMELYPFHSERVTGPMVPPRDVLHDYVLSPLSEMDVEFIFAFGKPWFEAAESIGLGSGSTVWANWTTPSRQGKSYRLPGGSRLIVLAQGGYAGPPGQADTEALRTELMR